ncbi:MAG: hypothetical protein IIC82_03600 [Chloroflexi bacterium]|nr:hypothetical protein [Chloroflexota bacterium]
MERYRPVQAPVLTDQIDTTLSRIPGLLAQLLASAIRVPLLAMMVVVSLVSVPILVAQLVTTALGELVGRVDGIVDDGIGRQPSRHADTATEGQQIPRPAEPMAYVAAAGARR